jgi:hypothetical protein
VLFHNVPLFASRLASSLISRTFPFGHAMHLALARFLRWEDGGAVRGFVLMRPPRGEAV